MGKSWQACWLLPDGSRGYKSNKHWLKRDALAYATDQEQTHQRRPGLVRSSDIPTFSEYANDVVKTRDIKASTRNSQRSLWVRVESEFGAMQLHEIRTRQIRAWVRELSDVGLAPSTVKQCYGLLRLTMENAVADDYLIGSPCIKVALPKAKTTRDAADVDSLERFVDAMDERYKAAVWFMAATGARVGETMALDVSDLVEVPSPQVSIYKGVTQGDNGSWFIDTTKTTSGVRTVSIPQWCWRVLQTHIANWNLGPDDFLFPAPLGGLLPPHRFRARFWNKARKVSGVDITPHQLRHLQASILIQENRPDAELAARLGHANSRVTHAVYSHWLGETDEAAAAVIPDMTQRKGAG
jgi:integrase